MYSYKQSVGELKPPDRKLNFLILHSSMAFLAQPQTLHLRSQFQYVPAYTWLLKERVYSYDLAKVRMLKRYYWNSICCIPLMNPYSLTYSSLPNAGAFDPSDNLRAVVVKVGFSGLGLEFGRYA